MWTMICQNNEREQYNKRINEFKNKKNDLKKQNNIKGTVIVENDEEEESSEEEFEENKGKIDEIYMKTMSEFNKTQKEEERKQREKEIAALAKLDIIKAERSKNKIISAAGKGLVTNNLSSKLKSLTQKKEYDASQLVKDEAKQLISEESKIEGINQLSSAIK